jgi:hypothetical protein
MRGGMGCQPRTSKEGWYPAHPGQKEQKPKTARSAPLPGTRKTSTFLGKNLKLAKTPNEIAEQLNRFSG